jgi:stress response protein YsnF
MGVESATIRCAGLQIVLDFSTRRRYNQVLEEQTAAMSEEEKDKQIDADIPERKKGILRAHDIIPGRAKDSKNLSGAESPPQIKSEVPKFDLAENIMAEQRKATADRRKAPGVKAASQTQKRKVLSTAYNIESQRVSLSEEDRIIAEIVARDIARLRGQA